MKRVVFGLIAITGSIATVLVLFGLLEMWASSRVGQSAWNIKGYRGHLLARKGSGEIRVLAIGGSTTFGFTVDEDETYPAYLDGLLRARFAPQGTHTSVANLGHLSDSSVCYEPTYGDYRALEGNVVVLYEGYNDVAAPARRYESDCYRRRSLFFRWTGLLPVAPIYLLEHWYRWRYGSIAAGYEAANAHAIEQRGQAQLTPEDAYDIYEHNVVAFVDSRLREGVGVVFASQPYLGDVRHLEQQQRIQVALEPFSESALFRHTDNMNLFGGVRDPRWFSAQMWLNAEGNRRLAERIVHPVFEVVEELLRERNDEPEGQ